LNPKCTWTFIKCFFTKFFFFVWIRNPIWPIPPHIV